MSHIRLFGWDHILVMVAVGVWAAMIGGRALWARAGRLRRHDVRRLRACHRGRFPLPFVEPVVLASVVALGLLIAAAVKLAGAGRRHALVGAFALFHGHAHGSELGSAGALAFGIGFALSTAALHGAGLILGNGTGKVGQADAGARLRCLFGARGSLPDGHLSERGPTIACADEAIVEAKSVEAEPVVLSIAVEYRRSQAAVDDRVRTPARFHGHVVTADPDRPVAVDHEAFEQGKSPCMRSMRAPQPVGEYDLIAIGPVLLVVLAVLVDPQILESLAIMITWPKSLQGR